MVVRPPAKQEVREPRDEWQRQREHQQREITSGIAPARIADRPADSQREHEGANDHAEHEAGFLADEGERHCGREDVQPAAPSLAQVGEGRVHPQHREQRDVNVLADVPAVEHERRADRDERRADQSGATSQVFAKEPDAANNGDAEQRRDEACREVRRAKESVNESVEVVEQRAVIGRVVAIETSREEFVRVVRVQALIVAHHARAEIPQPDQRGAEEQRNPRWPLPRHLPKRRIRAGHFPHRAT